jgi:CubicO group peptidase (beta-lactamase class C family)
MKRARSALFAAFLLVFLAPIASRADGWEAATPEAEGMSSKELAKLVGFGISNGMDSLLVTRHGKIVAEAYFAPFPSGMRHRINSATKSVISSLIGIALKDGLIKSLDQPVMEFLPGAKSAKPDERLNRITLRHLLDMTSGIDWFEPLNNQPPRSMLEMDRSRDWVQYVLDRGMARDPGAAFDYNSGGTHLLSAVLSKVTGKSAEDYAKEKLFGPLGITDYFWRHDPQGVSTGGYGLYLLPRDMAKLGTFWLHDGVWQGQQILPAGWIATARQGEVDMPFPGLRYGNLFWSVPGRNVFMAVGFDRQLIVMLPKLDIVAAFTGANRYSNAEGKPSMPKYSLMQVVSPLEAAVKSDQPLPEDPPALAELAARIKEVAEEARTERAGPPPPLAALISGKSWRLQPNLARITSISFTFDQGGADYALTIDGQRWGGPIGLDGFYAVGGRRLFGKSAAKGRWLDDKTFQLEMQTLGNDDAAVVPFVFDDKRMTGQLETFFGFKIDFRGELDE